MRRITLAVVAALAIILLGSGDSASGAVRDPDGAAPADASTRACIEDTSECFAASPTAHMQAPQDDPGGNASQATGLLQVAGQVLDTNGSPAAGATVHVCMEEPEPSCETTETAADGRFSIEVPQGEHYIAVTLKSNERRYYHADSPGHLITTDRRPERTFVTVPGEEASELMMRIPAREFARIVLDDPHRGPAHIAKVTVRVCRDDWTWYSVLPQCLIPSEEASPAFADRQLSAPIPAEPYYIRLEFSGYAVGGSVRWYYDENNASGLTSDGTRATVFPGGSASPHPLRVQLPDLPKSVPVRLTLNPGANLVGWPGGSITLAELAKAVPQVKGAVHIPSSAGTPQQAYAVHNPDAPKITLNSLWWFYSAADEPLSIVISTPAEPGWSHSGMWLEPGESLIAWRGSEPITLEQATRGLGELSQPPRLLRWTGTGLAYAETGLVRQGSVIWIDSPRPLVALLPNPWQPFYVLEGPVDDDWGPLSQRLEAIQAFFWERYGVIMNNFALYYRTSPEDYYLSYVLEGRCGWTGIYITLTCADPHSIARYYVGFLQRHLSYLLNRPAWLIEGAMEYAAALYTHHADGGRGDPLAAYREAARTEVQDNRAITELPADLRFWGDDRAATILSALAVDWLVRHSGEPDSLFDIFRRVFDYFLTDARNHHDWERAFEEVFGLSAEEFYEAFAEYRANGFRLDRE